MPDDWKLISEIDGYEAGAGPAKLNLCADNDVSTEIIDDLTGALGASVHLVHETNVDYGDDVEVRKWAKSKRRLLITGDHDYCDKEDLHPLADCAGILILNENDDAQKVRALLGMFTCLVVDLFQHVPWEWWTGTIIKVRAGSCRMWKAVGDDIFTFELRPDHRGILHFKLVG